VKRISSILTQDSHDMGRSERILIGLFIGIACPYLAFIAFWWSTALFHFYVLPLPTSVIAMMALVGLGLGCLLDAIFLRRWVGKFYTINPWLVVIIYLGLCVVAVGSCMGVPIGTFSLGIAAGAYVGRREHHRQADRVRSATAFRRIAVFAASVTTAAAVPIGILALQSEPEILTWLENILSLNRTSLQGGGGFILIGFLCLFLFVMQFWCTRTAGRVAFKIGTGRPQHQ
jgi:hypothetical protein